MFDEQLLKEVPELDMVLRGEADRSFGELCARLNGGEDITGVPGLSHRSNGAVNRGTPVIIQVWMPSPSLTGALWNLVSITPGGETSRSGNITIREPPHVQGVPVPLHLLFKNNPPQLGEWRFRTAESVFQEIVQLSEKGFTHIVMPDGEFHQEHYES